MQCNQNISTNSSYNCLEHITDYTNVLRQLWMVWRWMISYFRIEIIWLIHLQNLAGFTIHHWNISEWWIIYATNRNISNYCNITIVKNINPTTTYFIGFTAIEIVLFQMYFCLQYFENSSGKISKWIMKNSADSFWNKIAFRQMTFKTEILRLLFKIILIRFRASRALD